MNRYYICIDLKIFYASVECVERHLDPLNTNLVVADKSRTEKTVCLAITPSLKQYGLGGRARLFEVVQKVKEVNNQRRRENNYRQFRGKSYLDSELKKNKTLELDYLIAIPQMKKYMIYSTKIYNIYLKYLAPEDIFPYSIDEVFCDITNYLKFYKKTPEELATTIIKDVYNETGITATAGIGTNMYLAKIAMDIVAKHMKPNEIGVRMASLDEISYRKILWDHKPLTSFWRVGKGIAKKLEENGMYTMGDVALMSIKNENYLYNLFGVNAELLIDHAWGYEPTTIEDVKKYKPETSSLSSGQVLHRPYNYDETKLIVREMIDSLALDLTEKELTTKQIVLDLTYDVSNLTNPEIRNKYNGPITKDSYGRYVPKNGHGTINLDYYTFSSKILSEKCIQLYDEIVNKNLLIRKINITVCNLKAESKTKNDFVFEQLDLFNTIDKTLEKEETKKHQEDDKKLQHAIIDIKNKFGKNSILKGMNLEEGSTAIDRNREVGGHKG